MQVGIMGGSGYLGQQVLIQLQQHPTWKLISFSRHGQQNLPPDIQRMAHFVSTDFLHDNQWQPYLKQCDWVIDLVGILREQPRKKITYQTATFAPAQIVTDYIVQQQLTTKMLYVAANWAPWGLKKYLFYKDQTAHYIQQQLQQQAVIVYPNLIYDRKRLTSWGLAQLLRLGYFPAIAPMTRGAFSQEVDKILQNQVSFLQQRRFLHEKNM